MSKSCYFNNHELYIRDLLISYKHLPVLWHQSHPNYRNRHERNEAYTILAKKCQQFHPEADEDYVRAKIDCLRSAFRKERKKVLCSKQTAETPERVYKPSLWYYDLLLFTAGEEPEDVETESEPVPIVNIKEDVSVQPLLWTRKSTSLLIAAYRKHPCLYESQHPLHKNQRRRTEALRSMAISLSNSTKRRFSMQNVRRKIALLRAQFFHEYRKTQHEPEHICTLWYYDMLNFINCGNQAGNLQENGSKMTQDDEQKSSSESEDESQNIKKESDSSETENIQLEIKGSCNVEDEDVYDTIGRNLAFKMREMTDEQRNIANKIIREVMYNGQMERLTEWSRFTVDGS